MSDVFGQGKDYFQGVLGSAAYQWSGGLGNLIYCDGMGWDTDRVIHILVVTYL